MTLPRFLAPSLDPASAEVTLPVEEARHLTRVLRLGPGARVAVFDGRGREFVATVAAASRDRVTLRLDEVVARVPGPRVGIAIAQAILKGNKMDDVVRDATMLGVEEIVPLITEHISVKPAAVARGKPEERWGRVAVASAKQCQRATIPPVRSPVAMETWLGMRTQPDEMKLMFVEPNIGGPQVRSVRQLIAGSVPSSSSILIGPEGGWASREVELAIDGGYVPVTLGRLTLRADAVAIVALSALMAMWED